MYDQLGRREDLPNGLASLLGGSATYLYDRNQVIQTGASQAVNYLRMPGSGEDVIEDTRNANGGGGLYVPLLDGSGSTIAMVANATGDVASTYTYDPFGKASYGGSYITAYQYLGMENETLSGTTWAYYGGGTYYSPVLGRPLTIQGPITSAGGFGAGPGAMVGGALPGGSGDVWGSPFYSLPEGAAVPYWGSVGAVVGAEIGSYITIGEYTLGPPGAILGAILGSIFGSGLFGGGGPSEPWWWTREATRVGGSPSTWAPLYGMPAAYPPNQGKSAPSPRAPQHAQPRSPSSWGGRIVPVGDVVGPGANWPQRPPTAYWKKPPIPNDPNKVVPLSRSEAWVPPGAPFGPEFIPLLILPKPMCQSYSNMGMPLPAWCGPEPVR